MAYWQVSVICEGALDEDRQLTDAQLQPFVDSIEEWANAHPDKDVEIYTLFHDHARGRECECIQYVTDHHPAHAWGPNARANAS